MSLRALTSDERIQCLQYDYLHGSHIKFNKQQVAMIIRNLHTLHENNFVHGDIRKENILFSYDGTKAWLLDFDLAGEEYSLYPQGYNSNISERHPSAMAGHNRLKIHDRYALSVIIRQKFPDQVLQLQNPDSDLLDIANSLCKPFV